MFRYRAATADGAVRSGLLEAPSRDDLLARLRSAELLPLEASPVREQASTPRAGARFSAGDRRALTQTFSELAVLIGAGLTLDRALALSTDNAPNGSLKAMLADLHGRVKQGAPLSEALTALEPRSPPLAAAMTAAGEADGRLASALARLAETLEREQALARTVGSAMVYPILLVCLAGGVILLILLFVVPQFEGFFDGREAGLPLTTRLVVGASRGLREHGLLLLLAAVGAVFALRQLLGRPAARRAFDRQVLGFQVVGRLVQAAETARFARVLGGLVESGVPLPGALAIAQRSFGNSHMAAAVATVANGLKQGGGLSGPMAATGVLPPIAISFLRTGEETAQLGPMLNRLADVLEREVRLGVERLIGLLTPAITIFMGVVVATVIASLMSAILGFNDLALQ